MDERGYSVAVALPARRTLWRRLTGGKELWALSDQALVSGANFLTNVMLARALKPSGFGVFAICWMVVLLMSSFQTAAIVLPMMSVGPKQDAADHPYYYAAVMMQELTLAVAASLLVVICALGLSGYFPAWHTGALALPLTATVFTYMVQDFVRRYFFTLGRNQLAMASDALSYLTQLPILGWLAWRNSLSITGTLWIISLTSLFSVAVSLFWCGELRFRSGMTMTVARRHWGMVRWLAPSSVLQWSSLNLFVIFAPIFYGAAAAGALRACQNVVAIAHIWFLGLDNVLPSEAAGQLHQHGIGAALRYLRKMTVRWGLVTLSFMLIVCVKPAFWLHLLYGDRYVGYVYVLKLYSVLYLLIFLGGPLRAGLQALEYTAPLLWSYLVMTVFAVLLAAPLARWLGLRGVMLGLMASQLIFQAILGLSLWRRALRMSPLHEVSA